MVVFFDRDGTINMNLNGYVHRPEDLEFVPGAINGMKTLYNAGKGLFVVTNQSGIGRGMYSEQDFWSFMTHMGTQLLSSGINLSGTYFCPHLPDAPVKEYSVDCDCRKPKPGMLQRAAEDNGIDLSTAWMIGDSYRDIAAGKAAGCKTVLVKRDCVAFETENKYRVEPDFKASDLLEVSDIILRR